MHVVSALDEKFIVPTIIMISSVLSDATEEIQFHLLVPTGFLKGNFSKFIEEALYEFPDFNCKYYEIDILNLLKNEITMEGTAHFSDAFQFRSRNSDKDLAYHMHKRAALSSIIFLHLN
jgi:lipopolysaccharide biosynthesis glycosyltransferase